MSEKRLIWFKGEIISANSAKVSVLSPTSQFGANVFEGIRCYWDDNAGNLFAFKLDEHLRRLLDSVKLIRFENKYDFDYLKQQFIETVKANNYQDDTAVRQTIFLDGSGSWFSTGPTDMFIAPIKKGRFLEPGKTGLAVCISSWERIKDNSFSPRIKVVLTISTADLANLRLKEINMTRLYF